MKTIYIAYDGRKFDVEKECIEYEEIISSLIMVTDDFKLTKKIDKTSYLFIPTEKALNCLTKAFSFSDMDLKIGWNIYYKFDYREPSIYSFLSSYEYDKYRFEIIENLKNELEKLSQEKPNEIIMVDSDFKVQEYKDKMDYIFVPNEDARIHLNERIKSLYGDIDTRNIQIGWNQRACTRDDEYYSFLLNSYRYLKERYERKLYIKEKLEKIASPL